MTRQILVWLAMLAAAILVTVVAARIVRAAAGADALRAELQGLQTQETARGLVIVLSADRLFPPGGADLKPTGAGDLARVAEALRGEPDRNVRVEGHADNTGSQSWNLELSKRRAEVVGTALVRAGVEASRVTMQGFGDAVPVAGNDTSAGRQRNRRVEIVVQPPPPSLGGER
ncbi:MAG TPA: OmpA family protein [Myxococcota bacterium]|nr:OmpA family protein [Myxococcota bacterium]